ncbi:MAG TPA: YjbE family putative metal transport protein [Chloroflexota bacterium]
MPFSADLIPRILQIILIDLVLSGDNAVVIGMAAHPLPPRQRQVAIIFGGAAALALRVGLTAVAALLLGLPALKAIGGLLLLWIAYRLLQVEESGDGTAKQATTLRGAIGTILVADFVMSLDNVLGVAAASNGDVSLLLFGLVVSMAIVMIGGGIFAQLIDRLWWLAYVGALIISYTGVDMVLEDSLVHGAVELPMLAHWLIGGVVSVAVVALAHQVHRRQPALQRSAR